MSDIEKRFLKRKRHPNAKQTILISGRKSNHCKVGWQVKRARIHSVRVLSVDVYGWSVYMCVLKLILKLIVWVWDGVTDNETHRDADYFVLAMAGVAVQESGGGNQISLHLSLAGVYIGISALICSSIKSWPQTCATDGILVQVQFYKYHCWYSAQSKGDEKRYILPFISASWTNHKKEMTIVYDQKF